MSTPRWLDAQSGQLWCSSGKRGFGDLDAAEAALLRARWLRAQDPHRGRKPGRVEQSTYHCSGCGQWHLSSRPPRRGPRRRRRPPTRPCGR
ncbi:hypothetical protein Ae168Ps1_6190 [Pseudonocardia sp. Ae168_Ps1]|nr:hypothetical protein Ae168Ps1_6190 [Pseudonocardia sp. Ae168_Ps1]OLL71562.1 hypothetical protein Ae263Ps1_6050 [Pseudonocardia sp. Ae263_Ps1]